MSHCIALQSQQVHLLPSFQNRSAYGAMDFAIRPDTLQIQLIRLYSDIRLIFVRLLFHRSA